MVAQACVVWGHYLCARRAHSGPGFDLLAAPMASVSVRPGGWTQLGDHINVVHGDIAHVDLWAEPAFTLDAAIIELMQLYAHSLGSNLFVVEQNCMWQTPDRRVTRIWFKRVPDVLTYVAEFSQRDQSERQGYITYVLR